MMQAPDVSGNTLNYVVVALLGLITLACKQWWFPLQRRQAESRIKAHEAVAENMPKLAAGFERVAHETSKIGGIDKSLADLHEKVDKLADRKNRA